MFIDFPESHVIVEGMEEVKIPRMFRIQQIYDNHRIDNVADCMHKEMKEKVVDKDWYRGKRICITAGSRGIPHIDVIMRTLLDELKKWGAEPFLVPAMGSHGGATAEGQKALLAGYNLTEETMGVPILSSMEVIKIGALSDGTPVLCDQYAYKADGIIVLNKIKPHTNFRGEHESGIAKMMAIGISKHRGASMFHRMGWHTFKDRIPEYCEEFLKQAHVCFAVGIIQNAYDEISELELIPTANIMSREKELLTIAKGRIANFKFPQIDVLIIDEVGKNISGHGYDPNVVGRTYTPGFEDVMQISRIFIRSIAADSHHNGAGIACADVTTRKCLGEVDWDATWTNAVTALLPNSAKVPLYMNSDREALLLAIRTCPGIDYNKVKIVRIKNTLKMEDIQVSEAYWNEFQARSDIKILSDVYDMAFDQDGDLVF